MMVLRLSIKEKIAVQAEHKNKVTESGPRVAGHLRFVLFFLSFAILFSAVGVMLLGSICLLIGLDYMWVSSGWVAPMSL